MRKDKSIALRIDIDSYIGLVEGIPKIIDLFDEYNIRGSFYCVMGWEGDIFSTLKYRIIRDKKSKDDSIENKKLLMMNLNKVDLIKCLFFPRRLSKNNAILKYIKKRGHEIGVHGYIHVKWNNIKFNELENEFTKMCDSYKNIFGQNPISFSAPLGLDTKELSICLEKYNFKFESYFGDKIICPKIDGKTTHYVRIPVNLDKTQKHIPLIEYYSYQGLSPGKIVKKSIKDIEKRFEENDLVTTYVHPKCEGRYRFNEFTELIEYIYHKEYHIKTFMEIGQQHMEECK